MVLLLPQCPIHNNRDQSNQHSSNNSPDDNKDNDDRNRNNDNNDSLRNHQNNNDGNYGRNNNGTIIITTKIIEMEMVIKRKITILMRAKTMTIKMKR